jgi:hypothetical protein
MAKHFQGRTSADGIATAQWPAIHHEAAKYPHFEILVLNEDEAITDRQRRWFKGICCKGLSEWNGETVDEWENRLKAKCGSEIFKVINYNIEGQEYKRFESIANKGKKQITEFIENILSTAITMDWPVYPPDADLRRKD